MSNVGNVKPWFQEDLARALVSIYFASISSSPHDKGEPNKQYRVGFATALSSVALAIGVNPESFLAPEDIKLIRNVSQQD